MPYVLVCAWHVAVGKLQVTFKTVSPKLQHVKATDTQGKLAAPWSRSAKPNPVLGLLAPVGDSGGLLPMEKGVGYSNQLKLEFPLRNKVNSQHCSGCQRWCVRYVNKKHAVGWGLGVSSYRISNLGESLSKIRHICSKGLPHSRHYRQLIMRSWLINSSG